MDKIETQEDSADLVANVALRGEAWWHQAENSLRLAVVSLPVSLPIKEWIGDVAAQAWTEGAITAVQEYGDEMRMADKEFDRVWEQHMRAVAAWRSAHPGNDLVLPDMGVMLDWLCDEAGIPSTSPRDGVE